MGKSAYPTQSEVESLLTSAGITIGTLDTATAAVAGRLEFERRCGRLFLAPSAFTRHYDPPADGSWLDLRADLAALTSVQYQPEGGSAETLVQNTDFWLLPYNAADRSEPYHALELSRRWTPPLPPELHRSLRITGSWGWGTAAGWGIPDDAWDAMRRSAGLLVLAGYGMSISSGRVSQSEAGVERVWGTEPLAGIRKGWAADVARAVARYRKRGV